MDTKKHVLFSFFLLGAISIFLFFGCEKDEKQQFDDLVVFDISNESDWNYMAIASDGSYFLANEINGTPREVFFRGTESHHGYSIILDENGVLEMMVLDEYIIVFDNFTGTKADAALINPDGSIEVFRDVDWGSELSNKYLDWFPDKSSNWWEGLGLVGTILGAAACTAGVIFAKTGVGAYIAYASCGVFVTTTTVDQLPGDTQILGLSANTIGSVATVAGCVSAQDFSCYTGAISSGIGLFRSGYDYISNRQNTVDIAKGVLKGGHGDIQVTLTWNSVCDLDLWVTDPYGETIKWNNPTSASGGYLDYDNTYGYGPENVFWPDGMAPHGIYSVHVDYYSGSGVSTYSVLIIIGDEVLNNGQPITGQISPNQTIHVADFSYGDKSEPAMVLHKENLKNQLQKSIKTKTE